MSEETKQIKKKPTVISNVRYACAVGATNTVVAIKGAVPIANCSPGCQLKTTAMLTFENAFQGSIAAGGGNMPSANATENDVVFGGIKTLDNLIKSTLKIYEGDLFVVLTGCTGELIGDNVPDLVRSYQEAGYPIVYANTPGFKGNNLFGHEEVVNAIIDQFVGPYKGEKKKGLVNLWFETPYYNQNWRGDYQELVRILRGAGLEVNVLFGVVGNKEEEGVCGITVIATGIDGARKAPGTFTRGAFQSRPVYGSPTRTSAASIRSQLGTGASAMRNNNAAANAQSAAAPSGQPQPAQQPVKREFTTQRPVDIRGKVQDKQLNIPSFLQNK